MFFFIQLMHNKIVDTSLIFLDQYGRKQALRILAKEKLNRDIQSGNGIYWTECIMFRASNTDTEFRYSGIELNTEFLYWKLGNSGILEAKNGHFWPNFGPMLQQKCEFWTIFDWNHFR